jgi:uncharacterized RDD family membrane protein YckC
MSQADKEPDAEPRELVRYAGIWRRLPAEIIDWLLSVGLLLIPGLILKNVMHVQNTDDYVPAMSCYLILVSLLYKPLFECSKFQATPGKMALGIIVTDTRGRRISFPRAFGRRLGMILSEIPFYFGYLLIGVTEKKQGLQDILANCLVVCKPSSHGNFQMHGNGG